MTDYDRRLLESMRMWARDVDRLKREGWPRREIENSSLAALMSRGAADPERAALATVCGA
jgi:hypothetical protein